MHACNDLMVDFSVRALKVFKAGRGEPLNTLHVMHASLLLSEEIKPFIGVIVCV